MGNKGATAWEEYKKNSSGYGGYTSSTKAKGGASAWKEFRDSGALESAFADRRNFINGAYSRVFNYGRKVSSYYNSAEKDWTGLSWGNAAELASKNASAVDPLKTEGNDILAWLEENRDSLGYNSTANSTPRRTTSNGMPTVPPKSGRPLISKTCPAWRNLRKSGTNCTGLSMQMRPQE